MKSQLRIEKIRELLHQIGYERHKESLSGVIEIITLEVLNISIEEHIQELQKLKGENNGQN